MATWLDGTIVVVASLARQAELVRRRQQRSDDFSGPGEEHGEADERRGGENKWE
jgi:hypothetical protein